MICVSNWTTAYNADQVTMKCHLREAIIFVCFKLINRHGKEHQYKKESTHTTKRGWGWGVGGGGWMCGFLSGGEGGDLIKPYHDLNKLNIS